MKMFSALLLALFIAFAPLTPLAFAEETATVTETSTNTATATEVTVESGTILVGKPAGEEVTAIFTAIGGLKGAKALAIALVIVQGLILLGRSTIGDFLGKFKLMYVYGLTMVAAVISLKVAGVELGAALVHANTLAALQVFMNQIYKQFVQKEEVAVAVKV